ncbi:MAG: glycine cleavage system aminomethyltransferase GcvT [Acidimicrobiales bacterium]|nr:MAG: glycine cleavage system aminomethyltransferase GcvT [Acidimicrobiales bacterium]
MAALGDAGPAGTALLARLADDPLVESLLLLHDLHPLDVDARIQQALDKVRPLAYPAGTIAEHLACRREAVAFDVSHLGTVRVTGADAFDRLQATLTNDLAKIGPGRAQYTHLLDADDASVVDDIIVWWVAAHELHVMPNASNTARVVDAVGGDDVTAGRAVIAVQGPRAHERLASVAPAAAAATRFSVGRFNWHGVACLTAGTGYTGENGVELAVPVEAAPDLWKAVLDAGVLPAGLGARDTLRLEAGLPLHGHELGPGITPLQAGLGWVVSWEKGDFRGRTALDAEREAGVSRALRGLATDGRQPPRAGNPVLVEGQVAGEVTSGNYSPTLGHGIALALLPPTVEVGAQVAVEMRGTALAAEVVALPFVERPRP